MGKEHSVIIVPGLGDETRFLAFATRFWRGQGLEPIVYSVGWRDGENEFLPKLKRLMGLIDKLVGKGNVVPDFPLINKSFNLSYAGHDL